MLVTAVTRLPRLFVVSQIRVAQLTVQRLRHDLRALCGSLNFGRINNFILLGCKSVGVITVARHNRVVCDTRPAGSARWSTFMIVRITVTVRNYSSVIDTGLIPRCK